MARSHAKIVIQGKVASKPKFRTDQWGTDQALFLVNVPKYDKTANDGQGGYVKNPILISLVGENAKLADQLADGEWITITGEPDVHKWTELSNQAQEKKLSRSCVRTFRITKGGNVPINEVFIVGNVGEVRVNMTHSGNTIVGFGIATERYEKNEPAKDREGKPLLNDNGKQKMGAEVTVWTNVSIIGQRAKFASEAIKKGCKVAVSGFFESRTYEDRDDSTKTRYVTDLKSFGDFAVISKPSGGSGFGSYTDTDEFGGNFEDDWGGGYDSGDPGFSDAGKAPASKGGGRNAPPADYDDEIPF